MWAPVIMIIYITSFRSPWPTWIASVWGNCEGLVSAMICMSKRDIGEAVANLLSCGGRLWLSLTRVSAHDAQCPGTVLDIDLPAEDKAQGGRPSQG